jgi:5-methylthioadenosine/S-adenosylhomocysteine deaminase
MDADPFRRAAQGEGDADPTLHEDLQRALSDDEVERRRLSKSLLPHVRAFYANYFDPGQHAPFYRQSARQ